MYIIVFTHSFWINTKWSLGQVWLPVITNHLSMLEKDHNFIIEPTVKSAEIYIWWQRKAKTLHFLSDFIARWVVHWLAKLQFRVLIIVWINKKSSHGFLMSFFAVVLKIVKQHLFMHCFVSYRQHTSVSRDSITFSVHNRMLLLALRWLFFR